MKDRRKLIIDLKLGTPHKLHKCHLALLILLSTYRKNVMCNLNKLKLKLMKLASNFPK